MSLHKSKGLTARLVIIAGCVSGILPSINSKATNEEKNRQWQEQRRLFYVGLTRSTETLTISSAVRMPKGEPMGMGMPTFGHKGGMAILQGSPFLAELGPTAPQLFTATLGARTSDSKIGLLKNSTSTYDVIHLKGQKQPARMAEFGRAHTIDIEM